MAQQLFQLTNTIALLAWIPLIVFPRQTFVQNTLCKQLIPGVLAATYLGVISWKFATLGPPSADVMTLSGLRSIFSDDFLFAAAWTHYLAFDMVVGTVVAREAIACGIPWPLRSLSGSRGSDLLNGCPPLPSRRGPWFRGLHRGPA